jgi:hypothetical protein
MAYPGANIVETPKAVETMETVWGLPLWAWAWSTSIDVREMGFSTFENLVLLVSHGDGRMVGANRVDGSIRARIPIGHLGGRWVLRHLTLTMGVFGWVSRQILFLWTWRSEIHDVDG